MTTVYIPPEPTQQERMRELLIEARLCVAYAHREPKLNVDPALLARIDALLAEPVKPCTRCAAREAFNKTMRLGWGESLDRERFCNCLKCRTRDENAGTGG
jgi:hypothetical protein